MADVAIDDYRQSVQTNVVVTASGSAGPFTDMGAKEVVLVINVSGAVTGTTPTLTYTLAEVDPGDGVTLIGNSVTGAAISATGTQILSLPMMRGSSVKVSWTIGGTASPTFNGVYTNILNKLANSGIYDNAQNGPVAVKAASTAVAAADASLAVGLSPNSPLPAGSNALGSVSVSGITTSAADVSSSGALGALNAAVSVTHPGLASVGMQLAAGTFIGTLTPETSYDGGTTWNPSYFSDTGTSALLSTLTFGSANGAASKTFAVAGGAGMTRVRVSAYTSGTANVTVRASNVNNPVPLFAGVRGLPPPPITVQVGGSDGTNLQDILTDTGGRPLVKVTDGTNFLPTMDVAARAAFQKITDGTNGPAAVKAASTAPAATDPALVVAINPLSSVTSTLSATGGSSSYPDPSESYTGGPQPVYVDQFGNVQIRGPVFTDEESFRDDFTGSGLTTAITGTLTFTNGSPAVTGSGSIFTQELTSQSYIRLGSHANSVLVRVLSVDSDTALTLSSAYTGANGTGAGVEANWAIGNAVGSITVTGSVASIISGTANGNVTSLFRTGDFLPFVGTYQFTISQRIANQTVFIGFVDTVPYTAMAVGFQFTGTDNTKVTCISQYASDSISSSTITLASSGTTATQHTYEIDLSANVIAFLIDNILVAQFTLHIPPPYAVLNIGAYIQNTAVVTATTLALDNVFFQNTDQVQIGAIFKGEPVPTQLYGKATTSGLLQSVTTDGNGNLNVITSSVPSTSTPGIAFGDPTLASATQAPVRRTAYTEQATNFTGSIKSSSASDASAGTGARTVTITWIDQTGATKGTEVVTLNGTTAVNLVTTTKCFIESMVVSTVGTGGASAGTITLFTGAAGAGTAVGTIQAGDNQTYWAHHYVITGKVCNVTGTLIGSNSTVAGNGAAYVLKATNIAVATAPERQVSDFLTLFGQSSQTPRNYGSYIQVSGPARVTMYVTPNAGTSTTYRGSFDFYDQ